MAPHDAGAAADAGPPCPALGSTCPVEGDRCEGSSPCGYGLYCSANDPAISNPANGLPGCPISSARFKDDIEYVGSAGLQELHDETLAMHLATYNYKAQYDDPNPKHLGFIIEDNPRSAAVSWSHDRIDIYGYLSMVVATMQVQEKEITELRRELDSAERGACVSASSKP
jgi:hypothetical protein